jgi:AcrR family transcriptional regulator
MMTVIVKGFTMPEDSRMAMVRAATRLFQERGYAATSFHDVIARSGAPRGSIYHHFPGGKEQLAAEALQWYAERMRAKLAQSPQDALEAIESYLEATRESLRRSDFRAGCPVAAVALDLSPQDEKLHAVIAAAVQDWQTVLVAAFERAGAGADKARRLSTFVIAAIEGALIVSRIERSLRPVDDIAEELTAYVRGELLATSG